MRFFRGTSSYVARAAGFIARQILRGIATSINTSVDTTGSGGRRRRTAPNGPVVSDNDRF